MRINARVVFRRHGSEIGVLDTGLIGRCRSQRPEAVKHPCKQILTVCITICMVIDVDGKQRSLPRGNDQMPYPRDGLIGRLPAESNTGARQRPEPGFLDRIDQADG